MNTGIAIFVGIGVYVVACLACCIRVIYKRYRQPAAEGFASKAYDEPSAGVTIQQRDSEPLMDEPTPLDEESRTNLLN